MYKGEEMRLRSHTSKDHQGKGRCKDASPCPAKRSQSDFGKCFKDTKPKVKHETNKRRAEDPSKKLLINLENEPKKTTMTFVHELPGPSKNNNEKIKPEDSSSFELPEGHFVLLSNLPAARAVFSIAKIREKIFSFMNPRDLLQLRLVSRDWRRDATNEALLNWDKNVIALTKYKYQKFEEPGHKLTELMNKTGSNKFPCFYFMITLTNAKDEEAIPAFLATHGYRIHHLVFNLCYDEKCEEVANAKNITMCSHQQNWLFQILAKLLFHQAPNLETIDIAFRNFGFKQKACKPILGNFIIDQSPQVLHAKLRSVEFSRNITVSVFDFICKVAPKLTEFKCTNLNYFLDPINRLYLLKDLAYYPDIDGPEENLIIKRIANTDGKLNLHELSIQFPFSSYENPKYWPEVIDTINKLLEKSCHSLKKLKMNAAEFLPGLKFPVMTSVCAIVCIEDVLNDAQRHFFPREVCLSETFPKLTNLHIASYIDRSRRRNNCCDDDYFLISSKKEVVSTVREIKIDRVGDGDGFGLEKYQQWFPNAKIVRYQQEKGDSESLFCQKFRN